MMIVPVTAGHHAGRYRASQHRRRDDLHVQQLDRLVRRKLDERHVMRDAGVVDQHRDGLRRAEIGDRCNARVGAQIGDERTHLDVGERSHELVEPIATPAHRHEVVAFGAESEGEGATDAGARAGDERQPAHDRGPRLRVQVV